MPGIQHVILDMDEVLVDLTTAVSKAVNKTPVWKPGVYKLHKALNIPPGLLWGKYCSRFSFWAKLPEHEWIERLIHFLDEHAWSWSVATMPIKYSPFCAAGKIFWLQHHFGKSFKRYCITPEKWRLSRRGTVLIDDCDENCEKFYRKGGGESIVFPHVWNSMHEKAANGDRLPWVFESLERLDKMLMLSKVA